MCQLIPQAHNPGIGPRVSNREREKRNEEHTFFPSTFAPKIQLSVLLNRLSLLISTHSCVQSRSASAVASTMGAASFSALAIASPMKSTWVSIAGGMLVKGPLGPVIMKKLGKLGTVQPR